MGRLAKTVPILLVPVAAILLQSSLASSATLSQGPVPKWLERKTGSIAIVALDGNVKTVDQSGSWQTDVTSDASVSEDESGVSYFYQFPAWSPDRPYGRLCRNAEDRAGGHRHERLDGARGRDAARPGLFGR